MDVRRCNGICSRCHATRDNIGRNVMETTNMNRKKRQSGWQQEEVRTLHTVFVTSERRLQHWAVQPGWHTEQLDAAGTLRYNAKSINQLAPTVRYFPYLPFSLFVSNTLSLNTHAQVPFIMPPVPPSFVMLKELSIFFFFFHFGCCKYGHVSG